MSWRPIETAPKDADTVILAWPNDSGWMVSGEGYWHESKDSWVWVGDHKPCAPNHWMPMPTPPGSE